MGRTTETSREVAEDETANEATKYAKREKFSSFICDSGAARGKVVGVLDDDLKVQI